MTRYVMRDVEAMRTSVHQGFLDDLKRRWAAIEERGLEHTPFGEFMALAEEVPLLVAAIEAERED